MNNTDTIIVGCGISCISLLHYLNKSGYCHRVIVLECGRRIEERICSVDTGDFCNDCSPCNSISGFGGAICSSAPLKVSCFPSGKRIEQILCLESIEKYTSEALDFFELVNDDFVIPVVTGFPFHVRSYPISVLHSDKVTSLFHKWIHQINQSNNVSILYNTQVESITHQAGKFIIRYIQDNQKGDISGQNVVLAFGRKGVFQFTPILKSMGVMFSEPVISIGLRFMCPNYLLDGARNDHPDFKTSIMYKGLKYKTFCFSAGESGGALKNMNYGDFTLIDGHIASDNNESLYSNFALLTHVISKGVASSLEQVKKTVLTKYVKLNKNRNGFPVYQSYNDFKARHICRCEQHQTSSLFAREYDCADLSSLLTNIQHAGFCHVFEKLLSAFIAKYNPSIDLCKALTEVYVVGLELEGLWNEIELDTNFQSNIEGMFFIGDCTGRAHGVMAAAISGIALGKYLSTDNKKMK